MVATEKDTIYIDVDDEITSIVEKVKNSPKNIVALVLPKRAVVMQSIVNLKLLRRAANDAEKRVVLITSEASLLPLAGAVGMYVAKNLQSKPEVPPAPQIGHSDDDEVEGDLEDVPIDASKTLGELSSEDLIDETEKDNTSKKSKKSSGRKVPNFEKFRLKLFLGLAGFILIAVFWWWAAIIAPKATIVIESDASTVTPTITFTADKNVKQVSVADKIVPAQFATKEYKAEQKAAATGQKDVSAKSSGTITFSKPCGPENPPTIASGTGVSAENLTFITQGSVTLAPTISNGCKFTGSVKVLAQNKGEQYNIEATSYTLNGYAGVTASGSAMTGGSSKTVKVVSQQDIDGAKQKIDEGASATKQQLKAQLEQDGYYAITDSFEVIKDSTQISPALDQEATEFSVKTERVYSMVGVKKDDLSQLVKQAVANEQQGQQQQIQNDGLDNTAFRVVERKDNIIKFSVQPTVSIGPAINNDELKKSVAGKKKGDTENVVKAIPGVKGAEVKYSPFWVTKTPKNVNKITIELKKAQQ